DLETATAFSSAAAAQDATLRVHVKANTGMNRLGVRPDAIPSFVASLRALPGIEVEGIFTHFATSDETDRQHAEAQFTVFEQILAALARDGLRPPIAHAANSAALLTMPHTHLDLARSGIALYGLDPDMDQCT